MSELTTHKGVDALNCLLLLLLQCWIVPVQHFCKCEHCESPLFLRTFVAYYRMFPCENISTVWAIVYFEKKSAVFQLGGHRLSFLWDLILCHFTREKLYTENIWKLKSKKKKIIERGVYNRQRVSQRFPQGLFVGSTITSSILVHSELINCCWSWSANAFSFVKSVVFVLPSFLLHLVFFYFRLHQHTFKLNFRKQTLLSAKTKKNYERPTIFPRYVYCYWYADKNDWMFLHRIHEYTSFILAGVSVSMLTVVCVWCQPMSHHFYDDCVIRLYCCYPIFLHDFYISFQCIRGLPVSNDYSHTRNPYPLYRQLFFSAKLQKTNPVRLCFHTQKHATRPIPKGWRSEKKYSRDSYVRKLDEKLIRCDCTVLLIRLRSNRLRAMIKKTRNK